MRRATTGGNTHTIEDARVTRATDRAILIDAPDLDEPTWLPRSQVDDDSDVYDDSEDGRGPGRLVVSVWIADQKGWL